MTFWLVQIYNRQGQYCGWHYLCAVSEADARETLDNADMLLASDEDTFRESYNPRGVRWPQSIRHVYTADAKKHIAAIGEPLGGVRILSA